MPKKTSNPLCPRCNKNPAIIDVRYGVTHCKKCRAKDVKIKEAARFATLTMQDRITSQQDHDLGGIAQPWTEDGKPNPVFIKANPDAVHDYFSPEELKDV